MSHHLSHMEARLRDIRTMTVRLLAHTEPGGPLSGDAEIAAALREACFNLQKAIERLPFTQVGR